MFGDDEPSDVNPFGGKNIGKLKVETWKKMKKLIKAKFLSENHRQEAFLDYHNLSQQNMTVEEVINEFDKLRMRCDVVEEEEQVVARFLGVLKLEIADLIKAKTKGSTSRFTPPTRTTPPTARKTTPKATTPTTSAAGTTKERVDNSPCCYKCGRLGYYARDFSNLKTLAFVPYDVGLIYDTNPEVDEPGDEFISLSTKCTSKGKISDMIIDGDSFENVVSTYMVEKLGMKTKGHLEPNQSSWLKKGILLKSINIVLYSFLLENKTCGLQNTYSFNKDGVNITLVPFDYCQTQAEGFNLFMRKTGFEELMKTSPYVFTLVVVEENEIISEAPPQVQPLLRSLLPDNIPPGLPAMRDI
nr:reverse transcriptase domain-containing protein [Tanacetum cinerariifolium]